MGGFKFFVLNIFVIELWEWCIYWNIWVFVVYIVGKLNVDVDFKFCFFLDKYEWMLNRNVFIEILIEFLEFNMDLFVFRLIL